MFVILIHNFICPYLQIERNGTLNYRFCSLRKPCQELRLLVIDYSIKHKSFKSVSKRAGLPGPHSPSSTLFYLLLGTYHTLTYCAFYLSICSLSSLHPPPPTLKLYGDRGFYLFDPPPYAHHLEWHQTYNSHQIIWGTNEWRKHYWRPSINCLFPTTT